MRYCILSTPRTGSTWLNNGIGYCFQKLKNYINLNEFFTPFINNNHYSLDNNNMIYHAIEIKESFEIADINEFNEFRMNILLNGNIKQPLILKYMYWPYEGVKYNDLDNLKKIQNHNITIINLNRDTFESAVSFCVAKYTGIAHKYTDATGLTWFQTSRGRLTEIPDKKITVDNNDFEIIYMQCIDAFLQKQKMAEQLNCVTVQYSSLRINCFNNKIPFQSISHLKKLYNEDYSSIITNYDQLIETRDKINKMMNLPDSLGKLTL
jgi:hypothetical protein